jgi:hypothetical protein
LIVADAIYREGVAEIRTTDACTTGSFYQSDHASGGYPRHGPLDLVQHCSPSRCSFHKHSCVQPAGERPAAIQQWLSDPRSVQYRWLHPVVCFFSGRFARPMPLPTLHNKVGHLTNLGLATTSHTTRFRPLLLHYQHASRMRFIKGMDEKWKLNREVGSTSDAM